MTYTIGSLFSGAGGLDMGVQMTLGPADLAWCIEYIEELERVLWGEGLIPHTLHQKT